MSEVKVFQNDSFGSIRTVMIDDEPFFVGKDVADVLGYSNTRDALSRHVDVEDKNTVVISDGTSGNPNQTVINESGLYSLILSSKLQKAKEFKRWVTSEVLPSIRKHGVYAYDTLLENPDFLIQALQSLKEERAKRKELEAVKEAQQAKIEEMSPKARYFDLVMQSKTLVPITIIAKDYGWTAQKMNNFLHDMGVQFKMNKTWILYKKYQDKNYVASKTYYITATNYEQTSMQTQWTQAGRLFIYELMKEHGFLPTIERDDAA